MSYETTVNSRLGICIPTYKRPEQLRSCVLSILQSATTLRVPIFISDDSVDDTTNTAVLSELQARYDLLYVSRNEKNLGIDGNILRCVDICKCDYAWIIGEDDRMADGAIMKMLMLLNPNMIKASGVGFIFSNYSYANNDFSCIFKPRVLQIEEDEVIDAPKFVEKYLWAAGFIGSCVINKRLWDSTSPEPYIGTYFAHLGRIAQSIRHAHVYLSAIPLVLNRADDVSTFTWSEKAFDVFFGWERMLNMLRYYYGDNVIEHAKKTSTCIFKHRTLLWLISKRADGIYDRARYLEFVRWHETRKWYLFLAYFVARLPASPLYIIKRALLSARYQLRKAKALISTTIC
jgi:glycosyltransferase involved in cell wall biosynthesis